MPYTDRQRQILELAAKGLSDKEIARALGLSAHTVRTHLKRLYQGQQLSNRAEAVAAWVTEQHEQRAGDEVPIETSPEPSPAPETQSGENRRRPSRLAAALALVIVLALAAGGVLVLPRINLSRAFERPPLLGSSQPAGQLADGSPQLGQAQTPGSRPSAGITPAAVQSPSSPSVGPTAGAAVKTEIGSGEEALINEDRAAAGLPPLTWNDCLAAVAVLNAQRMAAQHYVSTTNGVSLDRECQLGSVVPGENLGYWSSINDAAANSLFMANPLQRANIMGPFHYLGTAWAVSSNGTAFIAVEFS